MKKKYYIFEMDTNILNIASIVLFIVTIIFTLLIDKELLKNSFIINNYFLVLLSMLGYLCFHEILHSIAYVLNGAKFKNIMYGAAIEKGILYCLCKQNITKKNILISLLYPLIFIGIITYIIAIIYKLPLLLLLSIMNISGCIGDIIMFIFISKLDKKIEFSEFDNVVGFGIYSEKDLSKEKSFGIKYIETKETLEKNKKEKINISTASKITFIILILLGIIDIII